LRLCCIKFHEINESVVNAVSCVANNVGNSLILLPTGAVLQIKNIQKSGLYTTTTNNIIIHTFYRFLEWVMLHDKDSGHELEDFRREIKMKLYGDDSVIGIRNDANVLTPEMDRKFFKDVLNIEVEYATHFEFLGHYAVWMHDYKSYVAYYPMAKINGSLHLEAPNGDFESFARFCAFRVISWPETELFIAMCKACDQILERHTRNNDPRLKEMRTMLLAEDKIAELYLQLRPKTVLQSTNNEDFHWPEAWDEAEERITDLEIVNVSLDYDKFWRDLSHNIDMQEAGHVVSADDLEQVGHNFCRWAQQTDLNDRSLFEIQEDGSKMLYTVIEDEDSPPKYSVTLQCVRPIFALKNKPRKEGWDDLNNVTQPNLLGRDLVHKDPLWSETTTTTTTTTMSDQDQKTLNKMFSNMKTSPSNSGYGSRKRAKKTRNQKRKIRARTNRIMFMTGPMEQSLKPVMKPQSGGFRVSSKLRESMIGGTNPRRRSEMINALRWVETMIWSDSTGARIPRPVSASTALLFSKRVVKVYANFSDPVPQNNGKFFISTSNRFGGIDPFNYALSILDTSNGWDSIDYSSPTAWVRSAAGNSTDDVRYDPYYSYLFGTPQLYYKVIAGGAIGGGALLGDFPIEDVNNSEHQFSNINNTPTLNTYRISPGLYTITVHADFTANPTNTVNMAFGIDITQLSPPDVTTNLAGTAVTAVWHISVAKGNAITMSVTGTLTAAEMTISGNFSPALSPLNFGLVKTLSSVAVQMLFECDMNKFNASGTIAAAVLPGGSDSEIYDKYSQVAVNGGDIHTVEGLSRCVKKYNGKFENGASLFYLPEDKEDTFLYTPSKFLLNEWPHLVIAGQVSNPGTLNGMVEIGQLTVQKVYEYVPSNTAVSSEICFGSSDIQEEVYRHVGCISQAGCNPNHLKNVKTFMKNALSSAWGIAKTAGVDIGKKALAAAGQAALSSLPLLL